MEKIESIKLQYVQHNNNKIFKNIQIMDFGFRIGQQHQQFIYDRGIACFLGLAICDALGAYTECMQFIKQRKQPIISYDFNCVKQLIERNLIQKPDDKIGIWTDDCSLALCIADSLLINYQFKLKHIRFLFQMWNQHGLNNGGRKKSVCITNNTCLSINQFCKTQQDYSQLIEKSETNNGNQTLSRLTPIVLFYCKNQKECMQYSKKVTKITNNGEEIQQCSRLLSLILVRLINRQQSQSWKQTISQGCNDFCNILKTIPTVKCLAQSSKQPIDLYQKQAQNSKFKKQNKTPDDRNWNWKGQNFSYSKCRVKDQPLHVGSYCMDALAMALHIIWFSSSFQDAVLKAVNIGGNSGTVAAIVGQIAGAVYGLNEYMWHLYSQMQDYKSGRYEVFLIAYKLIQHSQK